MRRIAIWSEAVLCQREDGAEPLMALACRTLTPAERNFSQLEKGALALSFSVTHFRDYLLCRYLVLVTDYKFQVGIFREDKAISAMTVLRIQR